MSGYYVVLCDSKKYAMPGLDIRKFAEAMLSDVDKDDIGALLEAVEATKLMYPDCGP